MKIGYINFPENEIYFLLQLKELMKNNCSSIIIEKKEFIKINNYPSTLDEIINIVKEDDIIIVYELNSFGMTFDQLKQFLRILALKKIKLVLLKNELKIRDLK